MLSSISRVTKIVDDATATDKWVESVGCKMGNITVREVTGFIRKVGRVEEGHKVVGKIFFSFLGITDKAKEICGREDIEVWNLDRINRERRDLGLSSLRI